MFPRACNSMKNPPDINSLRDAPVNFPPGPMGPGFISPSSFQLPRKYLSLSTSGPGLGMGGFCAAATIAESMMAATAIIEAFFMVFSSVRTTKDFYGVPVGWYASRVRESIGLRKSGRGSQPKNLRTQLQSLGSWEH